jgi:hypothetical protein
VSEKTKRAIKNAQSRDIDNVQWAQETKRRQTKHSTTETEKMSETDPTIKRG